MPMEMRTVVFSREEVVEAITNHAPNLGADVALGTVMLATVSSGPSLSVTLKVVPAGQSTVETVDVAADTVGAALVHHCIAQGIPLPKDSDRRLQAVGEGVAIHFTMNQDSVALPAFV